MADDGDRKPVIIQGSVIDRVVNAKRSPIVPVWLRDDVTRRAAAKHAVRHVTHLALFHGARTPKYAARTVAYSPRGLGRAVAGTAGWIFDADARPLRVAAVQANDHAAHVKLEKLRAEHVRKRSTGVLLAGGGLAGGTAAASILVWPLAWAAVAVAAVLFLGYLGRPRYRPFLDVATSLPRAERLTQDIVTRALGALNIQQINAAIKDGKGIDYTNIPHRDGPGWRVDAALPYGVTAADVINKRDKLSSGLRRPLSCVWPEPSPEEHDGHLTLWVGDEALSKARQPPWPLLKAGKADLFKPVPFGTDQRMRPVELPLMYANLLIGSIPRRGKTVAMRDVLLAAALDPIAEIRCFELKGTGDLDPLEKVAHHFGSGADDETRERCLASLRQVYEVELIRRAKVIKGLPKDLCPDSKVTPELARRKSLGLHPLVFGLDEAQEAFSDPEHGAEFERMAVAVIKRGPALGIMLILGTQRPDAKSLPTGVTSNVSIRFCLQVMDQVANDMVLGTSSYKRGVNATLFTERDKGIGYLVGARETATVTKTYDVDGRAAERICDRARALREAAGTLTGQAIGEEEPDAPSVSLLADVGSVMRGEERVWSETICARLGELRPELYGGWNPTQLANALSGYRIETSQVWSSGANRRGVAAADIAAALGERRAGASR
jgi:S-DNA-T family DNA segregation ATPase FtsK/SpoIIIE